MKQKFLVIQFLVLLSLNIQQFSAASTAILKSLTTKRLTSWTTLTPTRTTLRLTTKKISTSLSPTTIKTSTRPFLSSSNPATTTTKSNLISGTYQVDSFSLSWIGNSKFTNFTMTNNNMQSGNYFAFGLSFDSSMGNDDVAVCQVNSNGSLSVIHYYNVAFGISTFLSSSNLTVGFSSIATSIKNGVASCSFTRANSLPSVTNYFDQNKKYYLLTAIGPILSSGTIGYHSNRNSSPDLISF